MEGRVIRSRNDGAADSTTVIVRRMTGSDVSDAHSILQESPEASPWSMESLLESVSQEEIWAAEMDGRLAGLLIGRIAADEFEILNLAVGGEFRRRGVATQLVRAALESAKIAGARKTFLEVRASNEGGIQLYKRLGFQTCGRRMNYYRDPVEDAVQMVFHNGESSTENS
jgi:ribosomal-protein-alanine N-acetyltransferase